MDGKRIDLKYPITIDGKEVSALFMGRFKTKHLKLLSEKFLKSITTNKKNVLSLDVLPDMIPLIASLLNIKEEEADEIDFVDLVKISQGFEGIMGN